jgi:methyl-accepting chemotaxis protein
MNFSASSAQQEILLAQNTSKIEAGVLQLRLHEKNFLVRKNADYADQFNTQINNLKLRIEKLKEDLKEINISSLETMSLSQNLTNYERFFSKVVEAQRRIGFTPQDGLYGELSDAANNVEAAIADSVIFLKMMLEVRSSEKNYILLFDDKYLTKFNNDFDTLQKSVETSFLVRSQKKLTLDALQAYKATFLLLIDEQQKLGHHYNEGFQKTMNQNAIAFQTNLVGLVKQSNEASSDYTREIMKVTYALFLLALLISIATAWALSRNIISAISHIKSAIMKISESNDLTIVVETKSKDEFADIAKAFNYMISNFQTLLTSIKKSETKSEKAPEIFVEDSFWNDFILEEFPEDDKK